MEPKKNPHPHTAKINKTHEFDFFYEGDLESPVCKRCGKPENHEIHNNEHTAGANMTWKSRYSHAKKENYNISVDWDNPSDVVAHVVGAHEKNWSEPDDTFVNSIITAAQNPSGRAELQQIHGLFHRRGFMAQHLEHGHADEYHGETPEWSKRIMDDED